MRMVLAALLLGLAAGSAPSSVDQDLDRFAQAADRGQAAYHAHDWRAAEQAFAEAFRLEPQRAQALYYVAASAAHLGETAKALDALDRYADFGAGASLDADKAFAGMPASRRLARIQAKFARNTAPRCPCRTIYQGDATPFIAEGLAYDKRTGRFLVAAVQQRRIISIHEGRVQDFARLPDGLSPLGIRIVERDRLVWVAAAAMAQGEGATAAQRGRSALLAFDLTSGALRARHDAPPAPGGRALNDVAIGTDGSVYASDSIAGSIFRLAPGAAVLSFVGAPDLLKSPQGMVVSADGRTLLVADYAAGLVTVSVASGEVHVLSAPEGVTTVTMDGLVQLADGGFAATQNGIHPARLVHFSLSPDWRRVVRFAAVAQGPQFEEPTLLAAHGRGVLAITNSQWSSFDEASAPARPLSAWRVTSVALPAM